MVMMSLNSPLVHYIKLIGDTYLCIVHNGGALYLAGNIFIAIEMLEVGGCTMTIFQKLQHMMHLYFGVGM